MISGCVLSLPPQVPLPVLQLGADMRPRHVLSIDRSRMDGPFANMLLGMIRTHFPVRSLSVRNTVAMSKRPIVVAIYLGAALALSRSLKVFHLDEPRASRECVTFIVRGLAMSESVTVADLRNLPMRMEYRVMAVLVCNDSLEKLSIGILGRAYPYGSRYRMMPSIEEAVSCGVTMHARLRELQVEFATIVGNRLGLYHKWISTATGTRGICTARYLGPCGCHPVFAA